MMSPTAPGGGQVSPAPGQAPISPDKLKLLELPTWEEVEALLANPVMREFRLDIETDSTIRMDEEAEKKARVELISTVAGFLEQMVQAGMTAPEILPMLGELLMFGIRAFKTARSVEQTFDDMMDALERMAKQPRPPPPELQKVQAQAQADMQVQQARAASDEKIQEAKVQAEAQKSQLEAQLQAHQGQVDAQLQAHLKSIDAQSQETIQDLKNQFEAERVRWETAAKERIAVLEMQHKERLETAGHEHEQRMTRMAQQHEGSMKEKDRQHAERLESARQKREGAAATPKGK
jgi:Sec-independent protein translocase protein TatA